MIDITEDDYNNESAKSTWRDNLTFLQDASGAVQFSEPHVTDSGNEIILLDENVPPVLGDVFLGVGGLPFLVSHSAFQGASDRILLSYAAVNDCFLVTQDKKDFGRLIFGPQKCEPPRGVVLLRFSDLALPENVLRVEATLRKYWGRMDGAFLVVGEDKPRIRELPSQTERRGQTTLQRGTRDAVKSGPVDGTRTRREKQAVLLGLESSVG